MYNTSNRLRVKLLTNLNPLLKGIGTRSDENEQNRFQVYTKLFRSSLDLPHKNEDTPVVRNDGKNTMLMFCYWTNCIV